MLLTKYYWGNKIEEYEKGGACSTHLKYEKYVRIFDLKRREYLEDPGVDGK
jgi:hypothetical protein